MKAIVQDTYGTADVLKLRDIDMPEIREDEVLVRVHAAGVDQGVLHLMTGLPYLIRIMGFGLRTPKTKVRGLDLAGEVEAVGTSVTQFKVGDEVFGTCDGSFAEYASTTEDKLVLKPANLTFEQAAAVPTSAFAALHGLRDQAEVQAGQSVLVIGAAGGVGTYAVQLAKAFGAEVTGVCSTTKVEMVRSIGADHVIDYTRDDFAQTDLRYDVILDIAGNRSLSLLRSLLTPAGTLVFVGGEEGDRWFGGTDRQIRGIVTSMFVKQKLKAFVSKDNQEDLVVLKELIENGKISPVIDRTYPLSGVPDAIRHLAEGGARGKVVINI